MYEIKKDKICISLDPTFYLCSKTLSNIEIIKKATILSNELNKVLNKSARILFHTAFYTKEIDHINLFYYHELHDPIINTISIQMSSITERIKSELVDTAGNITDLFPTSCDETKQILSSILHYQMIHYYNRIIFSDQNKVLTINNIYHKTNSFDILSLDISSLDECTVGNYQNIISLYQWYFENKFDNKIYISLYCINKISTLNISFNEAIISLFRSIYFPDYMYVHDPSLIPNEYRIECHLSNSSDDKCKTTQHTKSGTYRFHVVPRIGRVTSAKDRMSYLKFDSTYIIVGISNCHEPLLFEPEIYKKIVTIRS
mgnify:CR=1 FL=1